MYKENFILENIERKLQKKINIDNKKLLKNKLLE
jgi:hypothetical protein